MKELVKKFPRRFFSSDRRMFQDELVKKYEELGYQTQGIVDKNKFIKTRNILVGNFKTAKTVIVVPYDTPKKILWFKSPYYPQNGQLQMKKTFVPTYVPLVLSYAFLLFMLYGIPTLFKLQSLVVLNMITFTYLLLLIELIVKGLPNGKNATRNDASLILAYDIAKELAKNNKNDVAFAFIDRTTFRIKGSLLLEGYFEKINKTPNIIALYCLGEGSTISIGYQKGMRKLEQSLAKAYKGETKMVGNTLSDEKCQQTILEVFKNALIISSGEIVDNELYVGHTATSKDNHMNEEMMKSLKEMLIKVLK